MSYANKTSRARRQSRGPGFTIIEMLVAIGLLTVIMFLIYRLFFDTLAAVSQGVALSSIHINTRTLNEQLQEDAGDMLGPDGAAEAGFIVILQHEISAARWDDSAPENIRSDQLLFIRENTTGEEPKVPQSLDVTFAGDVDRYSTNHGGGGVDPAPNYIRIWYGHLQLTNPDGTDSGLLGAAGANEFAGRWSLGRQALFLGPEMQGSGSLGLNNIYNSATHGPRAINSGLAWRDAQVDTDVSGYGSAGSNGFPATLNSQGGDLYMYEGIVDIADEALGPDPSGLGRGIIDFLGTFADDDYALNAYKYIYGTERLRANPSPKYDPSISNNEYAFATWQLAQMHPYLVPNVSDFIVEFAGDFSPADGDLDLHTDGTIKWYTHNGFSNDPGGTPDATKPLTFDSPVAANSIGTSPYYDTNNNPTYSDAAFVWRHDDTTGWPWLLRIRARLHDSAGRYISNDANADTPISGAWYETVIKVNR